MKPKTHKIKKTPRPVFHVPCFMFRDSGFTLVELVVAMGVFATVVTAVSSIFVSTVGSQRKNVNQQEVLENARYVLETISRSIRQSTITQPAGDATQSTLQLSHPVKGIVVYQLDNNQIKESLQGNPAVALSSTGVVITRLDFIVAGNSAPPSDNNQPRVTIVISLRNTEVKAGTESLINLQTTATPRNLQIQL